MFKYVRGNHIVASVAAGTALSLLKIHDMTTFHVVVILLVIIIVMFIICKKTFVDRGNIFFTVLTWFYIVYSLIGKDFKIDNVYVSNVISANLLVISLGSAVFRRQITHRKQDMLLFSYAIILCFPINVVGTDDYIIVIIRAGLFYMLFFLELYVGRLLEYNTNYQQLFLSTFFIFIIDKWYLLGSVVVVLSHFLQLPSKHINKPSYDSESEPESDTESETGFLINQNPTPTPNKGLNFGSII